MAAARFKAQEPTIYRDLQAGIYVIEHTASGRVYVGSAVNLERRWKDHRAALDAGRHHNHYLQRAWNRYGADAFTWRVIEWVADKTALLASEQRWIDSLSAAVAKTGFNLSPTAGSPLGIKRSLETRERNRQAALRTTRRPCSAETRARISAAQMGHPPHNGPHPTLLTTTQAHDALALLATGRTRKEVAATFGVKVSYIHDLAQRRIFQSVEVPTSVEQNIDNWRWKASRSPTCKNGHALTAENIASVSTRPSARICRTCKKQRDRDRYARGVRYGKNATEGVR